MSMIFAPSRAGAVDAFRQNYFGRQIGNALAGVGYGLMKAAERKRAMEAMSVMGQQMGSLIDQSMGLIPGVKSADGTPSPGTAFASQFGNLGYNMLAAGGDPSRTVSQLAQLGFGSVQDAISTRNNIIEDDAKTENDLSLAKYGRKTSWGLADKYADMQGAEAEAAEELEKLRQKGDALSSAGRELISRRESVTRLAEEGIPVDVSTGFPNKEGFLWNAGTPAATFEISNAVMGNAMGLRNKFNELQTDMRSNYPDLTGRFERSGGSFTDLAKAMHGLYRQNEEAGTLDSMFDEGALSVRVGEDGKVVNIEPSESGFMRRVAENYELLNEFRTKSGVDPMTLKALQSMNASPGGGSTAADPIKPLKDPAKQEQANRAAKFLDNLGDSDISRFIPDAAQKAQETAKQADYIKEGIEIFGKPRVERAIKTLKSKFDTKSKQGRELTNEDWEILAVEALLQQTVMQRAMQDNPGVLELFDMQGIESHVPKTVQARRDEGWFKKVIDMMKNNPELLQLTDKPFEIPQ